MTGGTPRGTAERKCSAGLGAARPTDMYFDVNRIFEQDR
jgi:hypothetical protein